MDSRLNCGRALVSGGADWLGTPVLLLLIVLAGWPLAAAGNPLPDAYVGVHVQEYREGFCAALPFTTCDELNDLTPLTGMLEFDFYYAAGWGQVGPWEDVRWQLYWPDDWSFVSAQVCGTGWLVEQSGNEAILELPTLSGVPSNPELYLYGLATVVLDVSSFGTVHSARIGGTISGEFGGFYFSTEWNGLAMVGYPCSGCRMRECGQFPARPHFIPEGLAVEIPEGSEREETIRVMNGGLEDCSPFEFSSSVPWITIIDVERDTDYWEDYQVTLRISAAALEPGFHEGLLLTSISSCTDCARIHATVLDVPSPASETTWGALKHRFSQRPE